MTTVTTEVAKLLQGRTREELLIARAMVEALLERQVDAMKDPGVQAPLSGWRFLTPDERRVIAGKVVMAIANLSQPDGDARQALN